MSATTKRDRGGARFGHPVSSETREKIRKANLGKKRTEEMRIQMSEFRKGRPSNRLGKTHSAETKEKIRLAKTGIKQSKATIEKRVAKITGMKRSEETRKRLSESHKGDRSHFWRGGLTALNAKIRNSIEYRLWREAVFKRDNYTCVWCGKRNGSHNADHIKRFSQYPELRFAVENGRTLCVPCHRKTDTFGNTRL